VARAREENAEEEGKVQSVVEESTPPIPVSLPTADRPVCPALEAVVRRARTPAPLAAPSARS
jgi:hypothetical protein